MIKKIIIRILTVVMLVAFIAVVGVQWFWIKYSMRESEIRFLLKGACGPGAGGKYD